MSSLKKDENIHVICPICKREKDISISKDIIIQAKQLTTVSIQSGLICNHHFQIFVDKNYKIRGYQKIDLEMKPKNEKALKSYSENKKVFSENDAKLFKNLILEENHIEYNPRELNEKDINPQKIYEETLDVHVRKEEMTLEQIYEEFWDLIDDDNYIFKELIIKDRQRRNKLKFTLNPIEQ
jgi:hypothetical protein